MIKILLTRNWWSNQLFQAFLSNINWKDKYRLPALPLTENQLFFVALTQVRYRYIQFDHMLLNSICLKKRVCFIHFQMQGNYKNTCFHFKLGNRFRKLYQKRWLPITSPIISGYLIIWLFIIYSYYLKINLNCPIPKCSKIGLNCITSVGFICFN